MQKSVSTWKPRKKKTVGGIWRHLSFLNAWSRSLNQPHLTSVRHLLRFPGLGASKINVYHIFKSMITSISLNVEEYRWYFHLDQFGYRRNMNIFCSVHEGVMPEMRDLSDGSFKLHEVRAECKSYSKFVAERDGTFSQPPQSKTGLCKS